MSSSGPNAVQVNVNQDLCMGSGTCMAIAPSLFGIADDGTALPLQSPVEQSSMLDQAVSRCPTGAIESRTSS